MLAHQLADGLVQLVGIVAVLVLRVHDGMRGTAGLHVGEQVG